MTDLDARRLASDLRRAVRGEVRFDDGSRALYATDASNYRQVPIGAVLPRDVEDVVRAVAVCREHDAPVLPRGGGTSLAGQCCNVAVVLDMTRYVNRLVEIDPDRRTARVEPGLVLDDLRQAANRHDLTFGPDPATHTHCTLGGMLGNNSCGVHSVMAGRTSENVESLDVLTYDGARLTVGRTTDEAFSRITAAGGRAADIYRRLGALRDRYADRIRERFPDIPRRVSGYDLPALLPEAGFDVARALVGSEGTLVTILGATVRLVPWPRGRSLLVLGYPDVYAAGDRVPEVLEAGPIGLEGLDDRLVQDMVASGIHPEGVRLLPDGHGWLLVEFGGETKAESDGRARALMDRLRGGPHPPSMILYDDPAKEAIIWRVREAGLGATANVPGRPLTWEGWEDSAVPPDRLGDYLRELRALFDRYRYGCALYGHFGQGCVHTRIDFDLETPWGIETYHAFLEEAADLVVRFGGSFSGEHGDGQSRAELLPKMFGDELMEAFRAFKAVWDPAGRMNPGKVIDAYRATDNLRLGAAYAPREPETHFAFPADRGSFARAALRCVGVGECRKHDAGTMCPSYMVTREERHSTRGRARLLFEMLEGQVIPDTWRNDAVKEALDLCLACKGCKGECPVNVDMATYKAEFLSHYYARRLRPRAAYAMGLVHWWARAASLAPDLANLVTQTPALAALVKAAGGLAPERALPAFAPQTFRQWFRRRAAPNGGGPEVILWPDTFNDHFHPRTAAAAVSVLEATGARVTIPERVLCCGRPLYDYGMLGLARRQLRRILDALRPEIRAGVPIVGLEPSCVSVFRDELGNLFPHDEDARRLGRQVLTLAEYLAQRADHVELPTMERRALVHGHCHHKAIMTMGADRVVLGKLGLDAEVLDSGCCGMAGSFGFEPGARYDVSVRAGERVLLPAVRRADAATLVIADGFSCREQIRQGTGRHAMHLAEVVAMALREAGRVAEPAPADGARPAA
ncbi:MAG TPA: FAD-linked oxidase C-terminal domain-containing protein, partial [Thermodesulfobacteriota bacterium]